MSAIADRYEAFLLDLDGVLYRGDEPIPGAAETLEALRDRGARVVFVTNNSARTPEQVAEKLSSMGIAADPAEVVTSSLAAAPLVREAVGDGVVFVIGEEGVRRALTDAGLRVAAADAEEADAVVVGWDRSADYERLRRASVLVQRGAPLFATNEDASYPAPGGEHWPGAGALLAVIERTTGVRARVAGKPETPLFEEALHRAGTRRAVVVGDRIETDIAGAAAAGLDAVAVLSGAGTRADLLDHPALPIDVLPAIPALLDERPPLGPRHGHPREASDLVRAAGLDPAPEGSEAIILGDGVATAAASVRAMDCYLHSVAVREDARSLGAGTLAVAAAIGRVRAQGASTAWLLTEDAAGFFERLGFEGTDRATLPPWIGSAAAACAETAVAMRREI